jgi:hypothetical protein
MNGWDPAHWSWARLAGFGFGWAFAVFAAAAWLLARAMAHAKQTGAGEGEFITVLPYGTRHLLIAVLILLLPPLLALLRKLAAG